MVIGERGRLRVRTAGDQDLLYLGRVAPDRDEETRSRGWSSAATTVRWR